MPSRVTVAKLLVPAAVGAAILAGCTSDSGTSSGGTSRVPSGNASASQATTNAATSSGLSQPSTTLSSPVGTPSRTAPALPTCDRAALAITVERGSGASGTQFATFSFTNTSAGTCTVTGFPAVSLSLAGSPLGLPAEPSAKTPAAVDLAPGAVAVANLTDFSSCDASNSDSVRVSPPGSSVIVELPLQLRGCRLEIDPLTAA